MDRDTKIGIIAGLAAIGIPIIGNLIVPTPSNRVIDSSDSPFVQYMIDENNDGVADRTISFLFGSRIPYIDNKKSTEQERDFYRTHLK